MHWNRLTKNEIHDLIIKALNTNVSYRNNKIMGVPGSALSPHIITPELVQGDPLLSVMLENPNHIGCLTIEKESESFFSGTHQLECEAIKICAEEIMQGLPNQQDGYIAGGGTECNIEAMWIFRNYFIQNFRSQTSEMGLLFSEDSSISVIKGCDLLNIRPFAVRVTPENRKMDKEHLRTQITSAKNEEIKYFIAIVNLGTEMFGSVDDLDMVCACLEECNMPYKVHVDAGLGGFIYPFTKPGNNLNFKNRNISSIHIDASKMLRTPFGTSVFMIRKGYMNFALTPEARYVAGKDHTIIGSRSGSNAIALWMLLRTLGSDGVRLMMEWILRRVHQLCEGLDSRGIGYFYEPGMNVIAIRHEDVTQGLKDNDALVPDDPENPRWWRTVVTDAVTPAFIEPVNNP
jgi:glutamate/tyrosine decarboxylase-like PLP-dependent enzyme